MLSAMPNGNASVPSAFSIIWSAVAISSPPSPRACSTSCGSRPMSSAIQRRRSAGERWRKPGMAEVFSDLLGAPASFGGGGRLGCLEEVDWSFIVFSSSKNRGWNQAVQAACTQPQIERLQAARHGKLAQRRGSGSHSDEDGDISSARTARTECSSFGSSGVHELGYFFCDDRRLCAPAELAERLHLRADRGDEL